MNTRHLKIAASTVTRDVETIIDRCDELIRALEATKAAAVDIQRNGLTAPQLPLNISGGLIPPVLLDELNTKAYAVNTLRGVLAVGLGDE